MIARVSLAQRVAAVAMSLAIAQSVGGAGVNADAGVNAVDPPGPGPLDRPLADLALVHAGTGASPMLLTLDTVDVPVGTVRTSLLRWATGWDPISSEIVVLPEPNDGTETPWLIELGPGSFALMSASHEQERTSLIPIRVGTPETGLDLQLDEPTALDIAVDDAGAIDVDGINELVVSAATTRRGGDVCQGSVIRVLDGSSFSQRAQWMVPDMRLAGGALGEWDGRPGGDLLAYAYGNCRAGPDSAQRLEIFAIRLGDGTPIVALSPEDPAGSSASPGVPLVADLDADGRDEVVIRDSTTLAILEPARDWARTEIARGDVMPLIAAGPAIRGDAGTVAWVSHEAAAGNLVTSIGKIGRAPDGSFTITTVGLDLAAIAPTRRARLLRSMRDMAVAQAAPQAWRGDIDGDGCPEILAPLLTAECDGEAAGDDGVRIGAFWFATRPVAIFDAVDNRELLVAATLEWDPADGGPLPATPAAAGPAGAWRHGPSARFALSEVRAGDAIYFDTYPVPRPTIERAAVPAAATDFPGFTGGRILVRVTAARPDDAPPAGAPALDAFLSQPAVSGELVAVARIPVPAGAESGRDGSFVHVSLADVVGANGGPAERWTVTIEELPSAGGWPRA